jgi:hypothetical protein
MVDTAIAESEPFVGDIEVDESYFGPSLGEFVANAKEARPVKNLFWACINDKEWCF